MGWFGAGTTTASRQGLGSGIDREVATIELPETHKGRVNEVCT